MASAAGAALSGSTGLIQEVADETDEQRRKRLLAQQQQRLLPGTSAAGAALVVLRARRRAQASAGPLGARWPTLDRAAAERALKDLGRETRKLLGDR